MALPTVAAILSFQCGYLAEIQVTPVLQITHLLALSTVQTECDTLAVQINALPGLSDALDACPTCSPFVCNPVTAGSPYLGLESESCDLLLAALPTIEASASSMLCFDGFIASTDCVNDLDDANLWLSSVIQQETDSPTSSPTESTNAPTSPPTHAPTHAPTLQPTLTPTSPPTELEQDRTASGTSGKKGTNGKKGKTQTSSDDGGSYNRGGSSAKSGKKSSGSSSSRRKSSKYQSIRFKNSNGSAPSTTNQALGTGLFVVAAVACVVGIAVRTRSWLKSRTYREVNRSLLDDAGRDVYDSMLTTQSVASSV
eukprot:m.176082 g.176082  ORF g.176082 m.176082 type:complete len:312 (-) comp14106_c0_seq1:109-1044(-)